MFRKRFHLVLKVTAILAVPVEQDQRKTISLFNVVVLNIHDYPKGMKNLIIWDVKILLYLALTLFLLIYTTYFCIVIKR